MGPHPARSVLGLQRDLRGFRATILQTAHHPRGPLLCDAIDASARDELRADER
jgi:hypothetical protein